MSAALMVTQIFRYDISKLDIDILTVQDTLLIHDLAEPDIRVTDRTPHDTYDADAHRKAEESVIRDILAHDPRLIELWLDYEDGRTLEWKLAMELDKLQAIAQARYYEDSLWIPGLTEEFYSYSVVKKKQIQTDFLLRYALELYESNPR